MNTENVALTQNLSSKVTKNYYTGGTFPAIPPFQTIKIKDTNINGNLLKILIRRINNNVRR